MKPSGQPRLAPNGGTRLNGGAVIAFVLGSFVSIMFPPFLTVVGLAGFIWWLVRFVERRERSKEARLHAQRMEDFYRAQAAEQRTFTNPGWRV